MMESMGKRSAEGSERLMQVIRRRDGATYVMEAYSPERQALEPLRRQLQGAYIQWERDGVPIPAGRDEVASSGPAYVLWRPESAPPGPAELEDLAELLAPTLDEIVYEAPLIDTPPVIKGPGAPESAAAAQPPALRRRIASSKNKSITRVDHPAKSTYGYMVRVDWKGARHQRFFSDRQHGGQSAALEAARSWRDAKEREIGKPRSEALTIGKGSSNTGILGVTRTVAGGDPIFQVSWSENGRQRRRVFNIRRLGEEAALREATLARAAAEAGRLERTRG
jgi:hypothetical protein